MTRALFEALSASSRFWVVSLVGIGFCVGFGCIWTSVLISFGLLD
jgi:uncharacterized membrane protein YciS (DUF1049 family)